MYSDVSPAAALVGTFAPFFICLLLPAIICGILCKKLAVRKGYVGYFWTGFFLNVIGLIYVAGLPSIKD